MSRASVPGPMALLQRGIPLSLLFDLAMGPQSEDLLRREARTLAQPPLAPPGAVSDLPRA